MKFKQLLNKSTMAVKKHSPAILTTAGIVGLGVTAFLAYKSRPKVEAVIEGIEEARENELEINKVEVARDLAEAVYLPVVVGAASVTAIFWSYKIQNRRIVSLAGALLAQQTRNAYFENKYKKVHGEEEYRKFMMPTEERREVTTDAKGKEKIVITEVQSDIDKTRGQWYSDSTEYASDDHTYNMAMIDGINDKLQTILFQRGTLLLNEVREALGFERIRAGQLLGWTSGDSFDIDKTVTTLGGDGELTQQIWVSWSAPRYIYDEIDYNGRYNPFA